MSTDTQAAPPVETGTLLEQDQRLSDSLLFSINRRYYDAKGPNAWHSGEVPSYATCNTYIAQAYAHVVLAYLRDARLAGAIDPAHPVYVVELAAGVGRFAFQFLTKLHELLAASSSRDLDVRYVMTDFTTTNIRVWSLHPHLQPFVAAGQLDFGTFDVDRDREIRLVGGQVLSAATVKNPMVVLANYAFDTFRHDLIRIADGGLHEVTVTTRAPHDVDLERPESVTKLRVQYGARPIGDDYYDDPALARVLASYRERLAEVTIGIPYGGLIGLRSLIEISGRRLLLVSSDKGFTHEDELYHPSQGSMQFHTGCFSMMVNYHAIGRYFVEQGGLYATTSRRYMNLKTVACLVGGDEAQYADTLLAFRDKIEEFGPGEFFELLQQERQGRGPATVEHFLGLLRMSHFDPGIVWDYAGLVRAQAGSLTEGLQLEVRLAIERAWRNYYPGPQNLPFELARIFMALRRPLDGVRFNQISIDWFGEQPATYLNKGICHYYSEDPDEALACFHRALELNPNFGLAREWTARVRAELARGAAVAKRPPPVPGATATVAAEPADVAAATLAKPTRPIRPAKPA